MNSKTLPIFFLLVFLPFDSLLAQSNKQDTLNNELVKDDSERNTILHSAPSISDGFTIRLDSLIISAMERHHIPGVAIIMIHGDSIFFSKGYGFADLENEVKINPATTVFRAGSVSKSLTATAVMILQERGLLNLKEDISSYLSPNEMEAFDIIGKKITIHDLLTHSAGFDERLFGSHVKYYKDWMPLKSYFQQYPLIFRSEPGEILNYNDQGIALAGYIVEKITGIPFYDFLEKEIFNPLQMKNSSFHPQLPENIKQRLAKSYTWEDGEHEALAYDYILPYPAAGLVATPEDMGRFLIMQLNDGQNLLSENTVHQMQSRQFSNHPKLRGWCYGFAEWEENGRRMIFKDGQATGFNSRLLLIPEQKWGFYLVWNRSIFNKGGHINASNKLKSAVTSLLLDHFFPDPTTNKLSPPQSISVNDHFYFEGNYRQMSIGTHDWSKFLSIALQGEVEKEEKGLWNIQGGKYVRIDTFLFQGHQGHKIYAAFSTDDKQIKYLHFGTGSQEKVPLFEHVNLQLVLLGIFHLLFLFITIFSFYQFKRKSEHKYVLAGLGGLLCFSALPIFAIVIFSVDFQELFKGATPTMIIASWMPFLGGLLVLISLIYNHRQRYIIWLMFACLLYIPYLIYWNFPILK